MERSLSTKTAGSDRRPSGDGTRPSLLILNLYMVYPPNSGAKVVIYNRIVELSKSFDVTFCCLSESPDDEAACRELRRFAEVVVAAEGIPQRGFWRRGWSLLRDPCATPFADKLSAWFSASAVRELISRRRFDIIELHSSCWYSRQLAGLAGRLVLVAHNRERTYYTERARAVRSLEGLAAGLMAGLDAALVAVQERRAIAASDAVVSLAPLTRTERNDWFGALPVLCNWGGVDTEAINPGDSSADTPLALGGGGPRLVFVAALFVESAAEGAFRFATEVLPEIVESFPYTRLVLVGDYRGNATIERLATEFAQVEVTGLVPDVRPYLRAADVVVVPIVRGSGVRYKIMEAMAAAKAVVSTVRGAEGLGLTHRDDALLARSLAEMGPLVLEALQDRELRTSLELRARATAAARFDSVGEHQRLATWYRELF